MSDSIAFYIGAEYVAQCESKVFFPDDPTQLPQFSECPRQSETRRRAWRFGDPAKGEPVVVNSVVKLCSRCAQLWDRTEIDAKDAGPINEAADLQLQAEYLKERTGRLLRC